MYIKLFTHTTLLTKVSLYKHLCVLNLLTSDIISELLEISKQKHTVLIENVKARVAVFAHSHCHNMKHGPEKICYSRIKSCYNSEDRTLIELYFCTLMLRESTNWIII